MRGRREEREPAARTAAFATLGLAALALGACTPPLGFGPTPVTRTAAAEAPGDWHARSVSPDLKVADGGEFGRFVESAPAGGSATVRLANGGSADVVVKGGVYRSGNGTRCRLIDVRVASGTGTHAACAPQGGAWDIMRAI